MSNAPSGVRERSSDFITEIAEQALTAAREWPWIRDPLTLEGARGFILQHVLRNRFYSAVMRPAWMSRCPDMAVVRKTIAQMGEELVFDPNIEAAHTKILYQQGRHIGLSDAEMDAAEPELPTATAFAVWENLARSRHWAVGWLGSSVDEFVFTALPDHCCQPAVWQQRLGLTEEQVFFWSYHMKADLEHAGDRVWRPLERWLTPELEAEIRRELPLILYSHGLFYEGVVACARRLGGP